MRSTALYLLVFVLTVLCGAGIGAQQGQKVDKHDEAAQAEDKSLEATIFGFPYRRGAIRDA